LNLETELADILFTKIKKFIASTPTSAQCDLISSVITSLLVQNANSFEQKEEFIMNFPSSQ
tara:strand:+ start:317 stop:499 length:183 start_codon:yes stop_codon:yes gene_type:complete